MQIAEKRITQTADFQADLAEAALFSHLTPSGNPLLEVALKVIAEQRTRIQALECEVLTDNMTGTLNKRGFTQALEREIGRSLRMKNTTALLVLFDLDGLKQMNDTHGHLAGDAYIIAFAEHLKNRVRKTDYVGRLGGDEFGVLMTDGDPDLMQQRIDAIVTALNNTGITHNGLPFTLRVSHGTALVTPTAELNNLIHEADSKLYRCKTERKKAH